MANKTIPLDGLIPGGKSYEQFQPKRLKQVQRSGDGVLMEKEEHIIFAKATKDQLETVAKCSKTEIEKLLEECGCKHHNDTITIHALKNKSGVFWTKTKQGIAFVNVVNKSIEKRIFIEEEWDNFDYCERNDTFAYTFENNLYLLNTEGVNKPLFDFDCLEDDIIIGQTAARNEFGIDKGTFWSEDGSKLAFFITDQRNETKYPIVHIEDPMASLENICYPMAGQPSEHTTIGIYDLKQGTISIIDKQGADKDHFLHFRATEKGLGLPDTDDIQTGNEDYLCCITFSPDGKYLLATELNRAQTDMSCNLFSASTGEFVKSIFTENDKKYVEPQYTPYFIGKNDLFVWQSRRYGYNNLYLYSIEKGFCHRLTKGDWEVTNIIGTNQNHSYLLVQGTYTSPLNRDVVKVDLDKHKASCHLICSFGSHDATLLKDDYFIDCFSSSSIPFIANLYHNCKKVKELERSNNPLSNYITPSVKNYHWICEEGRLTTPALECERDPNAIFYRLVCPPDMDIRKKYPLICYFYGGPHVQLIRNEWGCGTTGFEQMMAMEDCIVLTIDPHGSDKRGKEFEQKIWRNIGGPQIEDYVAGIKKVCEENSYIDVDRIGVFGWSFGGFMTSSLMLKVPDLFKVGVAGGPVIDWAMYEVMYGERYMSTPEANPKGYKQHNLRNHIGNLKGKLMLIHCNADPVVLWQNSLSIIKSSVKEGVHLDYNVYVGHPHNVRGPERVHLMETIRTYLLDHLYHS